WQRWELLNEESLLAVSIGMLVASGLYMLGWWIQTQFVSLQVTTERNIFQRGIIARATSEVRHDDVRNLRINQTLIQRLFGVGTIAISSAGQDDFEIMIKGVPSPEELVKTIRDYQ
ncbi:MAG: PH domain-containing protein, partial [Pirellulaceae bacterium]